MKKIFINISALICLLTCAGEFISLCILGKYYPGYSQLKNTMSQLGVSVSPVSSEISLWWIISGLLFTIFGIGVWIAFMGRGKPARLASLLIILYGLGEGIGSGIFKADLVPSGITISYIIHDIFEIFDF